MKRDIRKDDELLAKFLGWKLVKVDVAESRWVDENNKLIMDANLEPIGLCFGYDFNQLMKVVKKITEIYNSGIEGHEPGFQLFWEISEYLMYANIDVVRKSCIEFVEWYNQIEKENKNG